MTLAADLGRKATKQTNKIMLGYSRNLMNFSKARSVDVLRVSKSISISPSSLSSIPDSLAKTILTSVPNSSSVEYKIVYMVWYEIVH